MSERKRRIGIIVGAIAALALVTGLFVNDYILRGCAFALAIVWCIVFAPMLMKRNV
jgi:hypothetical protein